MSPYPEPSEQRQLELEDEQRRLLTRERYWRYGVLAVVLLGAIWLLAGCATQREGDLSSAQWGAIARCVGTKGCGH